LEEAVGVDEPEGGVEEGGRRWLRSLARSGPFELDVSDGIVSKAEPWRDQQCYGMSDHQPRE
jgi:hypothetical protein